MRSEIVGPTPVRIDILAVLAVKSGNLLERVQLILEFHRHRRVPVSLRGLDTLAEGLAGAVGISGVEAGAGEPAICVPLVVSEAEVRFEVGDDLRPPGETLVLDGEAEVRAGLVRSGGEHLSEGFDSWVVHVVPSVL